MTREEKVDCLNFVDAYNNYFSIILRLIRFYVKDEFVAQDLTQSVFLKSYIKGVCDFRWLKRVAINQSIDYLRKRARRRECEFVVQQHICKCIEFGEAYILIILNEIRKELERKINPAQYKIFQYLLDGLTYEEIAQKMELKISTLYVYVSELKKVIREMINS